VLVVCADEADGKGIHAGYLKPGMFVMDLTAGARMTPILRGGADRGCDIVNPLELLLDLLELQVKTLTGKAVPREVLRGAIPERFLEEE
jgi:shikimate 5-dehydrogenase